MPALGRRRNVDQEFKVRAGDTARLVECISRVKRKKKTPRFDSQQHIKLIKAAHACDPSAQKQTLLYVDQPRINETLK